MPPLVSILIPAYNAGVFIEDTIRSALAQSWSRKEIIVVDDGSTDDTVEKAKRYCSQTLQVVSQDNQGPSAARNTALSIAQGDYVQWLDADDMLSVDKISTQMRALDQSGTVRTLASCEWGYFRYRPWKAKFKPSPLWTNLSPLEWTLRKWETNSHMQTATWLVSRSLTEAAGPWNTLLSNDNDGEYFSRVVLASDRVKFVPGARVYYRVSPSQRVSHIGMSATKLDARFLSMRLQIDRVRSLRDDDRTRVACTRYLEEWMPHFDATRPDIVEQASKLANSWGARLRRPRLSWKYYWLSSVFGLRLARELQVQSRELRSSIAALSDKLALAAQQGRIDVHTL